MSSNKEEKRTDSGASCGPSEEYPEHQILGPGPEAEESSRAERNCTKNPGHPTFIPANELTIQSLPERYHNDENLFDIIKTTVHLTVRLRVSGTSTARPEDGHYGAHGGGNRSGTGTINNVEKNEGACACESCKDETEKSQEYWRFCVHTSKHVVYDEFEAKLSCVDLFYNSEECRRDGRMKTVRIGELDIANDDIDWCEIWFTTCDAELGRRLEYHRHRWESWCVGEMQLYVAYKSHNMVWIVSHPHGIAKRVTFGELKEELEIKESGIFQYSYDADTCPGSSGAQVWLIGAEKVRIATVGDSEIYHCNGGGKNGWNVGHF